MLGTFFYLFILFLMLCGVIVLFGFFGNPVRAESSVCPFPPRGECLRVKPPDYQVERPLLRRCEHAWRESLIADTLRSPQKLCFVDMKRDKLNTVAMVSTLNIMRAIGR